jgi:hypothetical protein
MLLRQSLAIMAALVFSTSHYYVATAFCRPTFSSRMMTTTSSAVRTALRTTSSSSETTKSPTVTTTTPTSSLSMDDIISLCKRRGFIFPSSEIYNGYAGFFDYGPLGAELKKNVKDAWWKYFVTRREDVVGLDSSIIHNPMTWKSSGTLYLVIFC